MRCGRCGNENKEGNRFCGMCGAPLAANTPVAVTRTPAPQPSVPSRSPASQSPLRATTPNVTTAQPQAPQTKNAFQEPSSNAAATRPATAPGAASGRRVEQLSDSQRERRYSEPAPESSITGPSFLGLNTPIARDAGRRGDGDYDDRNSDSYSGRRDSSNDLDYLLEDEEEPRRGWIKVLAGLVALGLAVGFGYLHYQQGGFEFLRNGAQKEATATPDGAQGAANSAGQSGTPTPDSNSVPPSAAPPAANSATPANSDSNSATTAQTPNSQNLPAAQSAATQNAAPANATPTAANGTAPDSGTPAAGAPADSGTTAKAPAKSEESSDSDDESSDAEAPAPKAAVAKPAAKPAAAKPSPARAIDRVQEAERYIYGRGVPQDCDHGVRLLKADQGDAKAMISLGGLYTTGTCTPRDLPTAYRWFALALHKQPDNQALQNDLQKLWSQMTQPERQLAIKLSQ